MRTELKKLPAIAACWFASLAMVGANQVSLAHGVEGHGTPTASSAAIASVRGDPRAVAETFSRALAMGDEDAACALLFPDVLIFESGGAESSAAEYAGHHMPADMAFLAGLKREQLSQDSGGDGTNAWVATRSRLSGRFKGEDVDFDSTETLVMIKTDAGWRITHIHWSSAPHRSPKP